MKLILSSCDFRNNVSRQCILDNLNKPLSESRILYIPNEKARYEDIHSDKYILRLQEFGFSKENIIVFDYYNPNAFFHLTIDIIFISGGNTFATLDRIRKSGFDKVIIDYVKAGVTYIGGSAGTHIASQNIEHIKHFDTVPVSMTDFNGLALFDGIFICHYTETRKDLYEFLKATTKFEVYKLTDDDSIVINT